MIHTRQNSPIVHIMMATFNGEEFLEQQLDSIANQSYPHWTLVVSDDCSSDNTINIIEDFKSKVHQSVVILRGPCIGSSTSNFFNLIRQVYSEESLDLYAFCDQDDIWLENKLDRAVNWHLSNRHQIFRLYCSSTIYVDQNLRTIGISPLLKIPPNFGNALVQNIASGNTMLMSYDVLIALKKVKPNHSIWHDWTTYLVATAIGAEIFFDNIPSILYRQHQNNVIGSNNGVISQLRRIKPLFQRRFRKWIDSNLSAVMDLESLPTNSAIDIYKNFISIRGIKSPLLRLNRWKKTNIRRQSLQGNLTLAIAIMLSLS